MRFSTLLPTIFALAHLPFTLSHPFQSSSYSSAPSAIVRPLLQAEPGSWFENLLSRPDGTLLITRLDTPSLYHLDPRTNTTTVVANFTAVTAALGIAEYAPDQYAVAVANFTRSTFTGVPGTSSIQTIDLRGGIRRVEPKLLVDVPQAGMLNGLVWREDLGMLYAADSFGYCIWGVDVERREVGVAAPIDELFGTLPGGSFPAGINGLKWDDWRQRLLFTDTNQILAGSVQWDESAGAFGKPVEIAKGINGTVLFDDLDFDEKTGDLFVANGGQGVNWISADGKRQAIVRQLGGPALNTPVATRFARGRGGKVLYVSTAGADTQGNEVGGQVVEYTWQ